MRAALGAGSGAGRRRDVSGDAPADEGGIQLNAWTATALAELTSAERQVADLLPIEADPAEAQRGARRGSLLVSHLRAQSCRGHLRAGYMRATTATGCPRSRRASRGSPCSISGPSTASTPSSRRPGAPSASSRSTTSSTSTGSRPAGTSSWRAARASARSTRCSTRASQYRKLDALDLDRLNESFDFIFCCGILHRVEAPGRLLEVLGRRLSEGGRVLIETLGVLERPTTATPSTATARARSTRRTTTSTGGSRPPGSRCSAGRVGSRASRLVDAPVIDGHPRIIGWLRR